MAQPPDITDTFVREVDENLRRDQLRDIAKKYSGWMITGLLLFLVAAGGFIYWQNYRQQQAEKQVETLSEVFTDIGSGNDKTVPKTLADLGKSGSKAVRASAMFASAALALQQSDVKLAIAKYKEIADDSSLPQAYRDAALIRQTALEFDSLKPEDVISRLEGLAKPGNPWFGSAGEMTAVALIKQGKKLEAGRLFAAMARDRQVSEAIRARSIQIASTLGVDASSAMPQPVQ